MDTASLEELILKTSEKPAAANCTALLAQLTAAGETLSADNAAKLELLWEAKPWSGEVTPEIAGFVLGVAALGGCDNSLYRKLLAGAVKRSLPPYLAYPPVLRALGVRDTRRPPLEVSRRLKRLLLLKNGTVIYLPDSSRWGVAGTVDGINGTLPISSFSGRGSSSSLPLENVLGNVVMLSPGTELSRLVLAGSSPLASQLFRAMIGRHALEPVPAEVMREMARTGCAAGLDAGRFESYWSQESSAAAPAAVGGGRVSSAGRGLKEIDVLLTAEKSAGNPPAFGEKDFAGFEAFFKRMRPETASREVKLLAQVVAGIAERTPEAQYPRLKEIVAGKLPFWPAVPARATNADLAVWGALSVKAMESLVRFGVAISDQEYLAALAVRLPLKALNCLAPRVDADIFFRALTGGRGCGADAMVWIWKNHKRLEGTELVKLLTIDNVIRTLATEDPPKEWGAARRELRQLLMDDPAFQGALIVSSGGVEALTTVLSSALFLSAGERQSLIVKLARISPEFLSHLEHGAGRKILDSAPDGEVPGAPEEGAHFSSIHSQARMKAELDDIINVQQPENQKALATARAHGDFRENAEFDAAKERRNELTRRRNELERELGRLQTITMAGIKVDDAAVIGSEIDLAYSDGKQETYWLLGEWDGDPQRRFISYRAPLGAAVFNLHVGDEFDAPGDRRAKLVAVRPLPAELIAELDHE